MSTVRELIVGDLVLLRFQDPRTNGAKTAPVKAKVATKKLDRNRLGFLRNSARLGD